MKFLTIFLSINLILPFGLEVQATDVPTEKVVKSVYEGIKLRCQDAVVWSVPLCGPTIFINKKTRSYVAVDLATGEISDSGVWPTERNIANTSVDWKDERWAMVMWPVPNETKKRNRLIFHENYHRIENQLSFSSGAYSPANHLDSKEGRISIRMEMHMLVNALMAKSSADRQAYALAAFGFRDARISTPAALESEKHLNINEGLAEYSALAAVYSEGIPTELISALKTAEQSTSLVRSFSYSTAPAWLFLFV